MNEIVFAIGYEKEYMVSDAGDVFRVTEKGLHKIKPIEDKDGYYRVCLSKNNTRKTVTVHRLVAEAFIPNIDMHPCINHKDENKKNNCVENLEWCSHHYNNNYNGKPYRGGLKRRKPIVAIGRGKELRFDSVIEASRALNINHANISSCLTGNRKTAGGMQFYYWKG